MSKKDKHASEIARLLMGSREKIRLAKNEEDEAKCNCPHQSSSGKTWVRAKKEDNDTVLLKCKECKVKIDLSPILNKDREDKKKYAKKTTKNFINLCNINKLSLSGESDSKFHKLLSKAQFYALKVYQFSKMTLVEGYQPKGKKNKKKDKNRARTNFILSGGGASY